MQSLKLLFRKSIKTWGLYSAGTLQSDNGFNNIPLNHQENLGSDKTLGFSGQGCSIFLNKENQITYINQQNQVEQIDYFALNKIQIKDIQLTQQGIYVLSQNKELYCLGSFLNKQKFNTPFLLKDNVTLFGVGKDFIFVQDSDKNVYNIGNNDEYQFINGQNKSSDKFILNKILSGKNIQKIRCTNYSVVMMIDNQLFASGKNNEGNLGTRKNKLINIDSELYNLIPINNQYYTNEKVLDFDLGFNSLIVKTEKQILYSGLNIEFYPVPLECPYKGVKQILASQDSVAVLYDNGTLFQKKDFIEDEEIIDPMSQNKDKILQIGGNYGNKFLLFE